MAEFTTILDGLEVQMRLGIHPHEADPQRVRLSVRMTVAYDRPPSADRIEEVLDYDFVRDGIHRLAAGQGFALQETLCEAVAALCLSDSRGAGGVGPVAEDGRLSGCGGGVRIIAAPIGWTALGRSRQMGREEREMAEPSARGFWTAYRGC